jgi:ubiquinone biosynthesis protein Coq4
LLPLYAKYFKKNRKAWNLTKQDLLHYPKDSLGYHLGNFLYQNQFELMPKLENHDCFHILTNFKTDVKDEIALQYLCFGNGERNLSAVLVMLSGTLLLPEHIKYYIKSFRKGKKYKPFYNINYKHFLQNNLQILKSKLL